MFIRKREYESKRGPTASYQVIESYREGGKVKQRTICNLMYLPTPAAALERARRMLAARAEDLPPRTPKHAEKRKLHAQELHARLTKLESVVAKMGSIVDVSATTTGKRSGKKVSRV